MNNSNGIDGCRPDFSPVRLRLYPLFFLSVLGFLLSVFSGSVARGTDIPVHVPDPELLSTIRAALMKPIGIITDRDIASLRSLDASFDARARLRRPPTGPRSPESDGATSGIDVVPPIRDLRGLESAVNLTTLNLSGTRRIGGDGVPFFLPGLSGAGRNGSITGQIPGERPGSPANGIPDFSPLRGLPKLAVVDLSGNRLVQCVLPDELPALRVLILRDNEMARFHLPTGSIALRSLDLSGNRLTDVAFPPGLTRLTDLDLSYNRLANLGMLKGLTGLSRLKITGWQLEGARVPATFRSLTEVWLSTEQLWTVSVPDVYVDLEFVVTD